MPTSERGGVEQQGGGRRERGRERETRSCKLGLHDASVRVLDTTERSWTKQTRSEVHLVRAGTAWHRSIRCCRIIAEV